MLVREKECRVIEEKRREGKGEFDICSDFFL